jgi:hypothetical protein
MQLPLSRLFDVMWQNAERELQLSPDTSADALRKEFDLNISNENPKIGDVLGAICALDGSVSQEELTDNIHHCARRASQQPTFSASAGLPKTTHPCPPKMTHVRFLPRLQFYARKTRILSSTTASLCTNT